MRRVASFASRCVVALRRLRCAALLRSRRLRCCAASFASFALLRCVVCVARCVVRCVVALRRFMVHGSRLAARGSNNELKRLALLELASRLEL